MLKLFLSKFDLPDSEHISQMETNDGKIHVGFSPEQDKLVLEMEERFLNTKPKEENKK